jgi:curved DNA-binding protein CbpA
MPYPNDGLEPASDIVWIGDRSARDILEVSLDASWREIQTSYRRLVRRWHPDKPDGDAARFR